MSEPYPLPSRPKQGTVEPSAPTSEPHRGVSPFEGQYDADDNVTVLGKVYQGIVTKNTPGTPGNSGVAHRVPKNNGNDYA